MKLKNKIEAHTEFPVVGIGASAGDLDAFKKFLNAIPENSGNAHVIVQHLSPGHESLLPEILQKVTKIPILEISDEIKIEVNHMSRPKKGDSIVEDRINFSGQRSVNKCTNTEL